MPVYRLGSSEHVHAPGIIAWAINGYAFERDRPVLRSVISGTWPGIPEDAVHELLSRSIRHEIDGGTVTFTFGEEPPNEILGSA